MSEDRTTATSAARGAQSVTWHPLFPAFVAVWFGALFGLGTLAVRVSLIERIAVASGIDRLIPAAAPPLGVNARILIALALAMLGGIIGAVIGRRMARSKPAARARRAAAADAAAELAEPAPIQAATFADPPSFIDISQLNLADEHKIEPKVPEAEVAQASPQPARDFRRPLDPVSFPLPASFPVPGGAAARRLNAADLDSLSHLELIERLALSLQKRREEIAAEAVNNAGDNMDGDAGDDRGSGGQPGAAIPALDVPSYYPPAPAPGPAPLARRFSAPHAAEPVGSRESGDADTRPVALFPGADAAAPASRTAALRQNPAGTERALRDALAALQRMSGAA